MILESLLRLAEAHPRTAAAIDAADRMLGRPATKLVQRLTERDNLRLQIQACGGGKPPWYAGVGALRARLDRLARTGRA